MIRALTTFLLATFFLAAAITLPGCNTIEGAGTDISKGGQAIKEEAREHK